MQTQIPVPTVEAATLLANSQWLLDIKQVYTFRENGDVIASSDTGKTISTGSWEQVHPLAVKMRFGSFYVGLLDVKGGAMTIVGQTSKWEAKRVK